jgi:hypothetical protein
VGLIKFFVIDLHSQTCIWRLGKKRTACILFLPVASQREEAIEEQKMETKWKQCSGS